MSLKCGKCQSCPPGPIRRSDGISPEGSTPLDLGAELSVPGRIPTPHSLATPRASITTAASTSTAASATPSTPSTSIIPTTTATPAARATHGGRDLEELHQPQQDAVVESYTAFKALELRKEVYRRGPSPTRKGPQANCS
ncbi:unnamed protein product [Phytophthora fragariaefolia]|uniref:Unnamed protein product n=1 Tax=Phytophthora fragariaefolia TaxID=1490495 RepID=A0A9W6Y0W3_9STRA|nr:unnamed protein product [Phytophthora fragariaefolia]